MPLDQLQIFQFIFYSEKFFTWFVSFTHATDLRLDKLTHNEISIIQPSNYMVQLFKII